jgi:hypothetical protein
MAKRGNHSQQVEGVIEHLNFAKNGDANGAVLDSGHFVHMKRRGAQAVGLRVGQTLQIRGKLRGRGSAGYEVIEAEVVNGVDLTSMRAGKKAAPAKTASKRVPTKKAASKKPITKTATKKTRAAAAGR